MIKKFPFLAYAAACALSCLFAVGTVQAQATPGVALAEPLLVAPEAVLPNAGKEQLKALPKFEHA